MYGMHAQSYIRITSLTKVVNDGMESGARLATLVDIRLPSNRYVRRRDNIEAEGNLIQGELIKLQANRALNDHQPLWIFIKIHLACL